ncbi:MAG: Asp-tRNA(Asn)/Glu-tRNA(Gln) amidotransferase subunit GatC [Patescibacteria group bacterium]
MISKEEVKHIAELARIKLTESQIEKYQKELSGILDFVSALANVDTTAVAPIRQITGLESVFRKDEDLGLLDQNQGQILIKQAPEHRDGFVVVPEVIKRDK